MAIIKEQDFLSNLHAIQSYNPPSFVLFSGTKKTYDIDLETRTINPPKTLSVTKDHESETIYFRVDRYHDYMDLSNTVCVIQYRIPGKKKEASTTKLYVVPFYDLVTDRVNNKMIIPWCVDGNVTKYSGMVNFSIRFFITEEYEENEIILDSEGKEVTTPVKKFRLLYNLTTQETQSEVVNGMDVSQLESEYDISANGYEQLCQLIMENKREGVYWDILD